MAWVPNKHLIEGGECARIVGSRAHHSQLVNAQVRARFQAAQRPHPLLGRAAHEHARIGLGHRVNPHHYLLAHVFGHVSHQPVRTNHNNYVLGRKQEARQ